MYAVYTCLQAWYWCTCTYMIVHTCGGQKLTWNHPLSTLFIEAGSLIQTQNVPVWLVSLANFFCGSPISAFQGWNYRPVVMSTSIYL